MSRFRRVLHGVLSSYALLVATAVYSLASVPVALHYLDKDRFGLWALMGTLSGYLTLIDAGISSAAARLLIDHKDDRDGGNYGSLIKTGWLVSIAQGLLIFLVGWAFAGPLARLLDIKPDLKAEFVQLVNWQCAVLAFNFATRMLNLMLGAHQRMDWVNYIGVTSLLLNFTAQWVLFHFGFGILSLVGGCLVAAVQTIVSQGLACDRLKLFPKPGSRGRFSWRHFTELFSYGKDLFLVSVGTQLILTSQIIIITRLLGMEAVATWAVGLRAYNLLTQIVWRVSDMSQAALAEMLARGEWARLRDRYRSLAILSFSIAGFMAASFAVCNSRFVTVWTHGRIDWPAGNDWLLALWMIISAVVHCHNCFALMTKQVGFMRYIYFLEGIVFVLSACLVARWGGLPAIIGCSIVCSTVFSGAYGVWRISRFFEVSIRTVAWDWLQPMIKMLLLYLPFAVLAWGLPVSCPVIVRLAVNAALAGSLGVILLLRYGIPAAFQKELMGRVPARFGSWLRNVFLKPTT